MPHQTNRLLENLDAHDEARLRLTFHDVPSDAVLYGDQEPLEFVYFPITAVIALTVAVPDDRFVEIAAVGPEGLVGMSALFGNLRHMGRALVQVPGKVARVSARTFAEFVAGNRSWQAKLLRYADAFLNEVARTAACHALHSAGARCARWLLTLADRAGQTDLTVNQESLADMLGIRRQTVGITLEAFTRARLVRKRRGSLAVLDREALVHQACSCYADITEQFKDLPKR